MAPLRRALARTLLLPPEAVMLLSGLTCLPLPLARSDSRLA